MCGRNRKHEFCRQTGKKENRIKAEAVKIDIYCLTSSFGIRS